MTAIDLLEALGVHLVAADRDPAYPFATGRRYGACPRCLRWEAIHVERDDSWRAACDCWGRPWRRRTAVDLLAAVPS